MGSLGSLGFSCGRSTTSFNKEVFSAMANSLGAKDWRFWRWIKTGKAERERETESARREGLHFTTKNICKRYGLRTTIQEQSQLWTFLSGFMFLRWHQWTACKSGKLRGPVDGASNLGTRLATAGLRRQNQVREGLAPQVPWFLGKPNPGMPLLTLRFTFCPWLCPVFGDRHARTGWLCGRCSSTCSYLLFNRGSPKISKLYF